MRLHPLQLAIGFAAFLAACDSQESINREPVYNPLRQPVPAGSWPLTDMPFSAALNGSGALFLTDAMQGTVREYQADGEFLVEHEIKIEGDTFLVQSVSFAFGKYYLFGWTGIGSVIAVCDADWHVLDYWQQHEPGGGGVPFVAVAVDASGYVYQLSFDDELVLKYRGDGTFIKQWKTHGISPGDTNWPGGIAVGANNEIYVSDTLNHRILMFGPAGELISQWGTQGSGAGEFGWPTGVATDEFGAVYVIDRINNRVQKFDRDGDFLLQFPSVGTGEYDTTPYGIVVGDQSILVFHVSGTVNRFAFQ